MATPIRGKIWTPDWNPGRGTVGGEWPYVECECGKWLDPKTGEHAMTVDLKELLKEVELECPDEKGTP